MNRKTRSKDILLTRDSLALCIHRMRVKGWKKFFQANGSQNKAGVATFISNIDFMYVYIYM